MRYMYHCNNPKCLLNQEITHPMDKESYTICPKCGEKTFNKVVTNPAITFAYSDTEGSIPRV